MKITKISELSTALIEGIPYFEGKIEITCNNKEILELIKALSSNSEVKLW